MLWNAKRTVRRYTLIVIVYVVVGVHLFLSRQFLRQHPTFGLPKSDTAYGLWSDRRDRRSARYIASMRKRATRPVPTPVRVTTECIDPVSQPVSSSLALPVV